MAQTAAQGTESGWRGVGTAALMSFALLVLSFVRRIGDMGTVGFHNGLLDNMLVDVRGTALGRNITLFCISLVLTHAAFGLVCWLLARLSRYAFPDVKASRVQWVVIWSAALAIWLLIENAAMFPHSSLGGPYADLVRAGPGVFNLFNIATVLLVCAALALGVSCVLRAVRARRWGRSGVQVAVTIGAAICALGIAVVYASHSTPAQLNKPHVIIIGIDSLRYDVASEKGPQSQAPNVRGFLDGAVSFSDAMTPLARTFPAWVSILTGRAPHTTGAIVNLLPRNLVHTGDTLGDLYRRAGYRTVYAIDEVRFSNVDASYGFDQAITPPIGASDFLLGWFGDTPLTNLIVNTPLGALAFPHLYANRADSVIYDPDEFVARLDRNLRFDEPTFLAMHLTLAHWPYVWARGNDIPLTAPDVKAAYGRAIHRVDKQFADVLALLERHGALKNALVIVLSDHGEGLAQPDDLLIPQGGLLGEFDASMQSLGHGTSVISPHQYQVLLSMRTFGPANVKLPRGAVIDAPVSLEDLAPTLADISQLQSREPFDGRSLVPLLHEESGAAEGFRNRIRFTETEFNPRGVEIAVKTTTSALVNASRYYRVDPVTDHLEVRPEQLSNVLSSRQFAAVLGGRMLAAIPRDLDLTVYDIVTLGRDGSAPRKLTREPSSTDDPELIQMWQALQGKLGLSPAALEGDAKP